MGTTRSNAGAVAVAVAVAASAGAARAADLPPAGPAAQAAPGGGGAVRPSIYYGLPPPIVTAEPSSARWYGWQILLADAASVGTTVVLAHTDLGSGAVTGTYCGLYLAGPVAVHLAHGEGDAIVGSIARRILFPLGGLALGAVLTSGDGHNEVISASVVGGSLGAAAGMLTAMVWDWTSRESPLSVASSPAGTSEPATRWGPSLALGRGSVALGLNGTF